MDPKKEIVTKLRVCLFSHINLEYGARSKVHELLKIEKFLGKAADIVLKERAKIGKLPKGSGEWENRPKIWPKHTEGD